MNLLASIIPGVRTARAPLIAGYMWLLVAWLVARPKEGLAGSEGALESVVALSHTMGPVATAIGVSVAAYLIGAVSRGIFTPLGVALRAVISRPHDPPAGALHHRRIQLFRRPEPPFEHAFFSFTTEEPDKEMRAAKRAWSEWMASNSQLAGTITRLKETSPGLAIRPLLDRVSELRPKLNTEELRSVDEEIQRAAIRADDELKLPATLLLGHEPRTFAETNRLHAEAELRIAAAPPLFVLSAVLSITANPLWIVAGICALILLWQGLQREDDARTLVAQAIAQEQIASPARDELNAHLDRLDAEIRDRPVPHEGLREALFKEIEETGEAAAQEVRDRLDAAVEKTSPVRPPASGETDELAT